MEKEKKLTEQQKRVMWEKGTEPAFSGEYLHNREKGMYHCASCGAELFASDSKFDSGTGWPSFDRPVNDEGVATGQDTSHGMQRTEVKCPKCGAHLGHVFEDGPTDTGKRYCINSCSLDFKEGKK